MKKNLLLMIGLLAPMSFASAQEGESDLANTVQEFVASRTDDLEASANFLYLNTREKTEALKKAMQNKLNKTGLAIDKLDKPTRELLEKKLVELEYAVTLEEQHAFEKFIKMEKGNVSGENGFYSKLTLQELRLLIKEKARGLQLMLALAQQEKADL